MLEGAGFIVCGTVGCVVAGAVGFAVGLSVGTLVKANCPRPSHCGLKMISNKAKRVGLTEISGLLQDNKRRNTTHVSKGG